MRNLRTTSHGQFKNYFVLLMYDLPHHIYELMLYALYTIYLLWVTEPNFVMAIRLLVSPRVYNEQRVSHSNKHCTETLGKVT